SSINAVGLNVGFTALESIDSLVCNNDWQSKAMGTIFWPLVYDQLWIMGPGPDYAPLPRLAEKWETRDHKTWRFFLNKNARFHDGKPVTSEDVIFTLLYLPKADSEWNTRDTAIKEYKILDRETFEITMDLAHTGPYPPVYWKPILPKHIWKRYENNLIGFDNKKAIGSGPYKLKEFVVGESLLLVRNEDYWGDRVGFDSIRFKSFNNSEDMNIALKTGEVDILGYQGALQSMARIFKETMGVKMIVSPGLELNWLSFNLSKRSPLRDITVRRAILHAIDREKIIGQVFDGNAKESNGFVFQELPEYNDKITKYEYNANRAEKMLKEAGYVDNNQDGIRSNRKSGEDLAFILMVPSVWSQQLSMAKMIQKQLQEIDLGIKLLEVNLDEYNNALSNLSESAFDIAVVRREVGPHSDWIWNLMKNIEKEGKGWNISSYENPAFDKIADRMMVELDVAKRKRYYDLMQDILADDLPYAMLVRPYVISPVREDKIEGYVVTMGGISTRINPWTYLRARLK
ncbi:peptide ABC transporter substrate-binding protein, partial [bacterium]|nr:peptide ABC transporter substrate-binding protein [bacterium]